MSSEDFYIFDSSKINVLSEKMLFMSEMSNIKFKGLIKNGKFGNIYEVDARECMAAKITAVENVGQYELAWQSFDNVHIVKLLYTHVYPEIRSRIFSHATRS